MQQIHKYGLKSNGNACFWSWDKEKVCWTLVKKPSFYIDGQELLLVPKQIVRKKYLFSTSQYFNRIILERIREKGGYMDGDKPISKKEIIKVKRFSGEDVYKRQSRRSAFVVPIWMKVLYLMKG